MLHDLVLEEEPLDNLIAALPTYAPTRQPADMLQMREDVARFRPEAGARAERQNASRDHESVAAVAILKAALADERGRTTELRGAVNELRISMAEIHTACDRLQAERDLWMQRARVLVVALCEDP